MVTLRFLYKEPIVVISVIRRKDAHPKCVIMHMKVLLRFKPASSLIYRIFEIKQLNIEAQAKQLTFFSASCRDRVCAGLLPPFAKPQHNFPAYED